MARAVAVSAIGCLTMSMASQIPALGQQQPDRSTVLVVVARANARCLSETGMMPAKAAQGIADQFLESQQISSKESNAITNKAGFTELMEAYIADQGGCTGLVKRLEP
ncbi:MAG: hypothetical protein CMN96_00705 [Synechococcus sp. MED850]|nr:hypothetical protein [Synechococcus sp. MED850]OUW99216.1 MAG: hypothetical protein CBD89_00510 [Cyanobacteria bacterium TMED229]